MVDCHAMTQNLVREVLAISRMKAIHKSILLGDRVAQERLLVLLPPSTRSCMASRECSWRHRNNPGASAKLRQPRSGLGSVRVCNRVCNPAAPPEILRETTVLSVDPQLRYSRRRGRLAEWVPPYNQGRPHAILGGIPDRPSSAAPRINRSSGSARASCRRSFDSRRSPSRVSP